MTFEGGKLSDPRSDDELTCLLLYYTIIWVGRYSAVERAL